MRTIFMNSKTQKERSRIKFVLNLSQEPKLKNCNEHVCLQNIAIYNTSKKNNQTVYEQ